MDTVQEDNEQKSKTYYLGRLSLTLSLMSLSHLANSRSDPDAPLSQIILSSLQQKSRVPKFQELLQKKEVYFYRRTGVGGGVLHPCWNLPPLLPYGLTVLFPEYSAVCSLTPNGWTGQPPLEFGVLDFSSCLCRSQWTSYSLVQWKEQRNKESGVPSWRLISATS